MFKSSKDDATAFTSDIVKLLKVRCNFGSTGIAFGYTAVYYARQKIRDVYAGLDYTYGQLPAVVKYLKELDKDTECSYYNFVVANSV